MLSGLPEVNDALRGRFRQLFVIGRRLFQRGRRFPLSPRAHEQDQARGRPRKIGRFAENENGVRPVCTHHPVNDLERHLNRNGTRIVKFFLNVSRAEQKKRFLERIEHPEKNWKFSAADVRERGHWDDYMAAYQTMIRETASDEAPWYVVPADNKWYTRLVVAAAIVDTLAALDLHYPKVTKEQLAALAAAKEELLAEKKRKR